jgi:hypothetical protein
MDQSLVFRQHYTEPEGSLPYSQELTSYPYPDFDQSNTDPPPILFVKDPC